MMSSPAVSPSRSLAYPRALNAVAGHTQPTTARHTDSQRPNTGCRQGVTEVVISHDDDSQVQWLLPLLAQLSLDDRWFTWLAPPQNLARDWLLTAGVDLNKFILLKPATGHDIHSLACRALRQGNCHLVVSWPYAEISQDAYQSLLQAAQVGNSHCILIRSR
ncbi:SulA-like leucine-rich domain-containing protein [Balneatrix alpica]|uniref:SulA-like leucine-rich domain-containing protein n=1 Tax=Balneatrix alpica TaxID=75684 RepID=UPI0027396651|nr:SulA-like leucine-rich domain-containing protein [Balneatrix alpica]